MDYRPHLQWIESQRERACELLRAWCNINSGSYNLDGLGRMAHVVGEAFGVLGGQRIDLSLPSYETIDARGKLVAHPLGGALRLTQTRPGAARVLLAIHMDTVYPADHPFQSVTEMDANTWRGPGVADAKGGLVVLLLALLALEHSPFAKGVSWEVLINPDEELGSPGSHDLLAEAAGRNDVGFVYEPALPDGALVSTRKGTGDFAVVVRGVAAHAGRDFQIGRSAIKVLSELVLALESLNDARLTVNVGLVQGGSSVNAVPDLAIGRFNVRITEPGQEAAFQRQLQEVIEPFQKRDGITVSIHGRFLAMPKPITPPIEALMNHVTACGHELGLNLSWRPTGGVCDGNRLAAAGLPTVDSLGVRGGNLHSDQEFVQLDSIVERAKLSALLLMKLGSGEIRSRPC